MNAPKVLIAYGTTRGSTAGIADMIADALRTEGISVDVRAAAQAGDVAGFDGIVLGGALYANRWHRDARRFARRNAKALTGRPVWIFSSGPLDASADGKDIGPVPQAADAARRLGAREHVTFGGRLSAEDGGFLARAMVRNGHGGDFRNPDRIASWSRAIADQLTAGMTTAHTIVADDSEIQAERQCGRPGHDATSALPPAGSGTPGAEAI